MKVKSNDGPIQCIAARVNVRGEDCQFFGVFYECELVGTSDVAIQAAESSGFAWVDKSNLADLDILEPSMSVIKNALTA